MFAGGGMPGPTLGTQSAAAGLVASVEALAGNGSQPISRARIAAAPKCVTLCRPGFWLCRIDPELRHGLRDICGTVLLAEGERM